MTSCVALIELQYPHSDKYSSCTYLGAHSILNPPPNGRCQRRACRECAIAANQGRYMKAHQYQHQNQWCTLCLTLNSILYYCFFSPWKIAVLEQLFLRFNPICSVNCCMVCLIMVGSCPQLYTSVGNEIDASLEKMVLSNQKKWMVGMPGSTT